MNDVPTVNAACEAESASSEKRSDVLRHEVERVSTVWRNDETSSHEYGALGHLSSDRAIREYCERIWKTPAR